MVSEKLGIPVKKYYSRVEELYKKFFSLKFVINN